jgi:hypothetical protein
MPPRKTTKRAATKDEIFSSRPVKKQKKFQPRAKVVKAGNRDVDIERPRKRKSQTTMTQLDFGNRSYIEAICDSDEGSVYESKLEPMSKPKKPSRRRKLPAKTESQDTLTQFVKRASDVSLMAISDSEDDIPLSDVEVGRLSGDLVKQEIPGSEGMPQDEVEIIEQPDEPLQVEQQPRAVSQEPSSPHHARMRHGLSITPAIAFPPKTPRRVRVLPVPSSRSPPDEYTSPQVKPCTYDKSEHRSPLQDRPVNIQRIPSGALQESHAKSLPKKMTSVAAAPDAPINIKEESPTKRRVREFNARFAILEQQNAGLRNRRSQCPATRPCDVRPSTGPLSHGRALTTRAQDPETQYPMPGFETQHEMTMRLANIVSDPVPSAIEQPAGGHMENSQPLDSQDVGDNATPENDVTESSQDFEGAAKIVEGSSQAIEENILIPSSQSRISKPMINNISDAHTMAVTRPQAVRNSKNQEESLLESTYNSTATRSTASKKDTQELASDQLMRETQQAFLERVPSSPIPSIPVSLAIDGAKTQQATTQTRHSLPRASQATAVDDSKSHSTISTQHLSTFKTQSYSKGHKDMMSSSPIEEPLGLEETVQVQVISSPLMHPPGLTDVSSSPKLPEPKTPSMLRSLKAPLRLSDLMSDSLDQSFPMPPSWHYDDDEEDDEL